MNEDGHVEDVVVEADVTSVDGESVVEDIARHGFEHDEQFLTMLQQVYFMYYNVGTARGTTRSTPRS